VTVTQIVSVRFPHTERLYAYQWNGNVPLAVGDTVVVPPNWVNEDFSRAVVAEYGSSSDYLGPLAEIVEKVTPEESE
jgi:hypothetical protein